MPAGTGPDMGAIEGPDSIPQYGIAFVVGNNTACNNAIGQIAALPLNGPGGGGTYSFSWRSLEGHPIATPSFTGATHTLANLYSGAYECTVTELGSGAQVVDTAYVGQRDSLTIDFTTVNVSCEGQADGGITPLVEGGSGGYTYTWTLPDGSSASQRSLKDIETGLYQLTVTDNDGCTITASDSVDFNYAKPDINIVSTINKNDGTTQLQGNTVRMCLGETVVLDAGSGFTTYEWTTPDGYNTINTRTVTAASDQTYYLEVTDSVGCTSRDTATVYVVQRPNIYASNVNKATGQNFSQVTSYINGDREKDSERWSWGRPSPYGLNSAHGKLQFIVSANELLNAGLTDQTSISSIAFEVVSGGNSLQNFNISMGHTHKTELNSYVHQDELESVFSIPSYTPVTNLLGEPTYNTHNFQNGFTWNGTDNVVVQVCYSNVNNGGVTNKVRVHALQGGNQLSRSSDSYYNSNCAQNYGGNSSEWRPNVRFAIDKVKALDTLRVCDQTTLNTINDFNTYRWYLNDSLVNTGSLLLSLNNPGLVYLEAVDNASGCTMRSDSVYVALDQSPVASISDVNGGLGTQLCTGDSLVLDAGAGFSSYKWHDGDTTRQKVIKEPGSVFVEVRNNSGCADIDSIDVTFNVPPDLLLSLNGRILTSTDGQASAYTSACQQSYNIPYAETWDFYAGADSLGTWYQDTTEALNWSLTSDSTNTSLSGPSEDFNSADGSGQYIFVEKAANTDDNKEVSYCNCCHFT
jgi:hypothetical protein